MCAYCVLNSVFIWIVLNCISKREVDVIKFYEIDVYFERQWKINDDPNGMEWDKVSCSWNRHNLLIFFFHWMRLHLCGVEWIKLYDNCFSENGRMFEIVRKYSKYLMRHGNGGIGTILMKELLVLRGWDILTKLSINSR